MTLATVETYALAQKAKRLTRDIAGLRDETKRDQELHHHPVGAYDPDGHDCPGCRYADRLSRILMEATR